MSSEISSNSPVYVSREEYEACKNEMVQAKKITDGEFYILRHQAHRAEKIGYFALDMLIKVELVEQTEEYYTVEYDFVEPHSIPLDESLSVAANGIIFERYLAHGIVPRRKTIVITKEEVGYMLSNEPNTGPPPTEDTTKQPWREPLTVFC